jgi:RNA polymerase sigma-70 factor (ECF subfamily)
MALIAARKEKPPPQTADGESPAQTAEALFAAYLDPVYRYISRRLTRPEEIEDITAEVFAAAVTALPRYRGQASPYVYLLGIARRKVADHLRRRRWRELLAVDLRPSRPDAESAWDELTEALSTRDQGPEESLLREERRQAVRRLVGLLKAEQREALLLRYVEGLSIAEVAEVLGKSLAAANSLLQRARETLLRNGKGYFLDDEAEGRNG